MLSTMETGYFGDLLSATVMRRIFCDRNRIISWLQVEATLASAQARCGIISQAAAEMIVTVARIEHLDLAAMKAEYDRVGFPISPLVLQMAKACDPEAARWIHWGATTQDIIDTGLVLQMRDGLALIEADLELIITALAQLTHDHRSTVGRRFQFGY